MHTTANNIAELNDRFRMAAGDSLGERLITPGIRALGPAAVMRIIERVKTFDDFKPNNPVDERDFGRFRHNGHSIYWAIDREDHDVFADLSKVPCTLTIMLEDEFEEHCAAHYHG